MPNVLRKLIALVALAAPALAQLGNPAPDFVARRWMNSPPLALEDLRGKVVLIEVFRTWSVDSIANVGGLSARAQKGADKGLVVIAVTDEEPELVAHWIKKYEPRYPIVALKTNEFASALGVRDYFPIQAVIDAEGTLVHSTGLAQGGFESPLANSLARATPGPVWPKKLDAALEHVRAGQLAQAWVVAQDALASGPTESLRAAAEKLSAQIAELAVEAEARAKELYAAGRLFEAKREALLLTAKAGKPALPNAGSIAKLLADIAAAPNVDAELKAGPAFVIGYELELERDFASALEKHRSFAKSNAKLAIGAAAQKRIDDLVARGLEGYGKDCPDCALKVKTCDAHAAKVRKK